jgi:hypothetical protein
MEDAGKGDIINAKLQVRDWHDIDTPVKLMEVLSDHTNLIKLVATKLIKQDEEIFVDYNLFGGDEDEQGAAAGEDVNSS